MEENEKRAEGILDKIIATTFTRHAGLSESEYLEKLGLKYDGRNEEDIVNACIFNLLRENTKEFLKAKRTFIILSNKMQLVQKEVQENG